jgi:hypothetical protein
VLGTKDTVKAMQVTPSAICAIDARDLWPRKPTRCEYTPHRPTKSLPPSTANHIPPVRAHFPLVEIAILATTKEVVLALELNSLHTQKFLGVSLKRDNHFACDNIKEFERAREDVVIVISLRPVVTVFALATNNDQCLVRSECSHIELVDVLFLSHVKQRVIVREDCPLSFEA